MLLLSDGLIMNIKPPTLYKRIKVKKPLTEYQRVKQEGRY